MLGAPNAFAREPWFINQIGSALLIRFVGHNGLLPREVPAHALESFECKARLLAAADHYAQSHRPWQRGRSLPPRGVNAREPTRLGQQHRRFKY